MSNFKLLFAFGCSNNARAYVDKAAVYVVSPPFAIPFSRQCRALFISDGVNGTPDFKREINIYAVNAVEELSLSCKPP